MTTHVIPQGTMAQALAALPIKTRHDFADPLDILETHLEFQELLRGRVVESMAWLADNTAIRLAKNVIFTRWKDHDKEPNETFQDFLQGIGHELAHESLYQDDTPEHTLAKLLAIRGQWHDAAFSLVGESYAPKTLREHILGDGEVREISSDVRKVFEINAQFWCDDESARAQFVADAVEADKLQQQQWRENDKRMLPAILEVIRYAAQHAAHETRFDDLPARLQASLFSSIAKMVATQTQRLGLRMAKQPIEYAKLNAAARKCAAELEQVVTNKFSDKGELENVKSQTQIDIDRNAKRKAWNDLT